MLKNKLNFYFLKCSDLNSTLNNWDNCQYIKHFKKWGNAYKNSDFLLKHERSETMGMQSYMTTVNYSSAMQNVIHKNWLLDNKLLQVRCKGHKLMLSLYGFFLQLLLYLTTYSFFICLFSKRVLWWQKSLYSDAGSLSNPSPVLWELLELEIRNCYSLLLWRRHAVLISPVSIRPISYSHC